MKAILFILSFLWVFEISGQGLLSNADKEMVFEGVNVIPMDQANVLYNQTVVVRNGKITALGAKGKIKYGRSAQVIPAKGKYLVPGWAEMHAHVPSTDDRGMEEVLFLYLANGITTIRGMLGSSKHLELRGKVKNGEVLGPHFYTTGPSFNGQSTPNPQKAVEMVRQQKTAGYDFLKLHPGLSKETFAAIASTAKEAGIPFAGHVSFRVGVWRAIEAGYSSIDHLDGFVEAITPGIDTLAERETGLFGAWIAERADLSKIPDLMKALKENNIWVVPTQALGERWLSAEPAAHFERDPHLKYMDAQTIKGWVSAKNNYNHHPSFSKERAEALIKLRRKLVLECHKNGVGLLLGCDAPQVFNVPGFSTQLELGYLVDAGLSPYEALRTGTVNVARYLNKADSGVVKTGNVSDLVLLSGNPLEDINQTKKIEGVMIGTQWLSADYIQAELKKIEKR